jgi:DNA-directed RNA polymerase specialized sigma24 family protein
VNVAREALVEYIRNPSTRTRLHAYARRRGLSDSADDLVQTVFCAALAVEAVPSDAAELPRFVTGIARNKVADEHRRRARQRHVELPELGSAPALEESDLLRRIAGELEGPVERETLSWLMREHAGDSLYEIARERALTPATLRQRICRLRRHLRARYLAPLALALGLGVGVSAWLRPSEPVSVSAPSPLAAYAGDWRVVRVEPERYASLALRVHIDARSIRVYVGDVLSRELSVERLDGVDLVLRAGPSRWPVKLEQLSAKRIEIRGPRGFVALER